MAQQYLISGIDVGNSQVKVVIAKIRRESSSPEIIGAGVSPSYGLRKGMVVDMEEVVRSIRGAVAQAQNMAGVPIKRAYLSVSGQHINTQISKGVIAVSRADNEISQSDIDRVLHAASVVSLPPNREVIDVIPRNYIVDGTEYIKNPLGMKGVRLEAEVFIIDGLAPHLRNLAKCVNENNIEVAGLVYAPLAATYAALDKTQKEYGVMHLDFGGGMSSMTIFEESDLVHSAVFPIGSRHITNDLAIALRTSLDVAERIKLEHASTSAIEDLRSRQNLDLSQALNEENFIYPRRQLLKVVDARSSELLDMVKAELTRISRFGRLPAGVVISGGGANLPGFALLAKDILKLPVRVARPLHTEGVPDIVGDPAFTVATGLILWGAERELDGGSKSVFGLGMQSGVIGKTLDWLKNFLP